MTSIRFMDLTTTKRRHTTAPNNMDDSKRRLEDTAYFGSDDSANSFEKCVVAGACTLPMLELYQHVSFRIVSLFTDRLLICHHSHAMSSRNTYLKVEASSVRLKRTPSKRIPLFSESISLQPLMSNLLWTTSSRMLRRMRDF